MTTESLAPARTLRLAGRRIPVVLPGWRDPRLHLAAVIVSLQVLGQTALGFELSIAQILVSVLTAAALEVGITLWRRRLLIWPASALLTGNGVAFILRVPGTRHGDWWSLHGAGIFAATAGISVLSKYVVRWRGRHLFNPSNLGLVIVFLLLGTRVVNPQDLWWGPMSPGLALTLAIIVAGGLLIVSRLRMLPMVVAFWVTFTACTGLLAATGHCMTARWHVGEVCGTSFWSILALSPEILVFMFFMITDPKTTPAGRRARVVHGGGVAFVAALLVAPVGGEFSTKVGVLAALVAVCATRPLVERWLPGAGGAPGDRFRLSLWRLRWRGVGLAVAVVGLAAVVLVGAGWRARGGPAEATALAATTAPATASIPTVAVDAAARRIDAALTAQVAQGMGQDVASGLGAGYRFRTMTVVLVTNPLRPQDAPKVGMAVAGTLNGAPLHETYVLTPTGSRWAIGPPKAP